MISYLQCFLRNSFRSSSTLTTCHSFEVDLKWKSKSIHTSKIFQQTDQIQSKSTQQTQQQNQKKQTNAVLKIPGVKHIIPGLKDEKYNYLQ
jgi:hypothetical protein